MTFEGWLGIGFGVISLILSLSFGLWSYHRTKQVRKLIYSQVRVPLILPDAFEPDHGREITLYGEPIKRLNREYIVLWSVGNMSVRMPDEITHIAMSFPTETRIHNAGLLKSDDPANGAKTEVWGNEAEFSFSHLRAGDAAVFYLDHSEADLITLSITEKEADTVRRVGHYNLDTMFPFTTAVVVSSVIFFSGLHFFRNSTWFWDTFPFLAAPQPLKIAALGALCILPFVLGFYCVRKVWLAAKPQPSPAVRYFIKRSYPYLRYLRYETEKR